jgi:4a-hydroxytetrahydrobiopterin dehydratase
MTDISPPRITRTAASAGVHEAGWRYILGAFQTAVPVSSLAEGLAVAAAALGVTEGDADEQLRYDVRSDRVELTLLPRTTAHVDHRSIELANAITAALAGQGWRTVALAADLAPLRSVQGFEVAIDTMDMSAIRPFWKAVLGYVDEPGSINGLVDPLRQGPAFWFQQMDEPRPQRNRIHFDITVPHDDAQKRIAAAVAAGGTVINDQYARSFWVLADAEGNEICICTWQDRDDRD